MSEQGNRTKHIGGTRVSVDLPPVEASVTAPEPERAGSNRPLLPRHEILALGDSLTASGYAELITARFGVPVVNGGLGGQTPPQIAARYGAIPIRVAVADGRLVRGPNRLVSVVPELLRASDGATRSAWARLDGVLGVYTFSTGPGGTPIHMFTPRAGEPLPAATPPGTELKLELGEIQSDMLLLSIGRNGGIENPRRLFDSIAAIMATYRPLVRRIVLLSVPNAASPDEARGTARHAAIVAINRELARRYPDAFLDIRAIFNAAGNPSMAADREARVHDWPPPSLLRDRIHYNDAGRAVWARAVGDAIARRGWLRERR